MGATEIHLMIFICPTADGTARMPGRDHEFRGPALRREQPVGSEDLSGELQGQPGEPQTTESRYDAEKRNIPCSTEIR